MLFVFIYILFKCVYTIKCMDYIKYINLKDINKQIYLYLYKMRS